MKEQLACVFFYPAGLDADRGSALGPRGNRSLHTPSTFFQQEKYCPLKQKYTMTRKKIIKKFSVGLEKDKLQSRVRAFLVK